MSSAPGRFAAELAGLDVGGLSAASVVATDNDVDCALAATHPDHTDLAALLSPAATERVEELAAKAAEVTLARFGKVIRLFAPLYLSNECLSTCTYCGFSKDLPIVRKTLTPEEVAREAQVLAERGFRHVLLVSGEHRTIVSPDYLVDCVSALVGWLPSVSIETQTWPRPVYEQLVAAGVEGVVHYQETYDRARYAETHLAGWKRDYDRRLVAVEDAAESGIRRLGVGALLGLADDWRADVLALAAHAQFLTRRYWRTEVTVALPRIVASASGYQPSAPISDREYVQALAALRLLAPDAGIVLSSREPAVLRDGLVRIAVTHMSAGSSTEPGGYTRKGASQEQFSVTDTRSPEQVANRLVELGYEPVWKDAFPLVTR